MSSFTHVNLRDIEDVVGDRAPGMEGRFGRKHLDSKELGVSYFRYGPNVRSPIGHSHREQEEAYVVRRGLRPGQARRRDRRADQWDVLRVSPEVVRAFEGGPEGLALLAIGGTRPEDGDGVPVPDWWTD